VVSFRFTLTGRGWADASLVIDDQSANLTSFSYLTDALGDFLRSALRLVQGSEQAEVWWEREPGGFAWKFTRDGVLVRVVITEYDTDTEEDPDEATRIVLSAACPLRDLAAAIAEGARNVLNEHGQEGYAAMWARYPFPMDELTALEDHLAAGA